MAHLFVPIVDFGLSSGLSAGEMCAALREAAVRNVAARQVSSGQRVNVSGIAASTGITRAEVARLWKTRFLPPAQKEQCTNRLLRMWHQNPEFNTVEGKPSRLRIYGSGATFESLVKQYGGGVPIRAALDELTRLGAVAVTSSRFVRAIKSTTIDSELTGRFVQQFGERGSALLSGMLNQARDRPIRSDIDSVSRAVRTIGQSAVFRKELLKKGIRVFHSICDSLSRRMIREDKTSRGAEARRVTVTISYCELSLETDGKKPIIKRKNLRRDGRVDAKYLRVSG